MMLKALPLVHIWSAFLLKEQMMTSVIETLKTLVWSAQNQSLSGDICPENNHKIGRFLPIAFQQSLPRKLPQNFREFVPKNPSKLDFLFFPWPIRSPEIYMPLALLEIVVKDLMSIMLGMWDHDDH